MRLSGLVSWGVSPVGPLKGAALTGRPGRVGYGCWGETTEFRLPDPDTPSWFKKKK